MSLLIDPSKHENLLGLLASNLTKKANPFSFEFPVGILKKIRNTSTAAKALTRRKKSSCAERRKEFAKRLDTKVRTLNFQT